MSSVAMRRGSQQIAGRLAGIGPDEDASGAESRPRPVAEKARRVAAARGDVEIADRVDLTGCTGWPLVARRALVASSALIPHRTLIADRALVAYGALIPCRARIALRSLRAGSAIGTG